MLDSREVVEALIEEMEIEEDLLRWNYQPNVHLDLGTKQHVKRNLSLTVVL